MENLDTGIDLALDLSGETLELVSHLRQIYNLSKDIPIEELKEILPSYLNSRGKKELLLTLSNSKFKEIIRSRGITNNKDVRELINLKNARSSDYFTDSRIINVTENLTESQLSKLLDNSSDLGLIDVARKESNLTSSAFDNFEKLKKIGNTLEIAGYAVDAAIAFKDIANGKDLEPADLLFFIPGAPELIKSIVDNISIETFIWENELPWEIIKNWNISDQTGKTGQQKYNIPGNLYLQYTKHKGRANLNVNPTSFVFLDSGIASEVFGFIPDYVNYNNENGFKGNTFEPQAQSNKINW